MYLFTVRRIMYWEEASQVVDAKYYISRNNREVIVVRLKYKGIDDDIIEVRRIQDRYPVKCQD